MEYLAFTQYELILLQGARFPYGTQIIVMVCEQKRQRLHMGGQFVMFLPQNPGK